MGDQRRSSWPWRKLKLGRISTSKSGDKSSHFSPSQLASPASSFKAEESSRFLANSWKQEATCSAAIEDARVGEAISLREKAEENLRGLKQELSTLMKELTAKEALVKQHQRVADEAVLGWEKADKEVVCLKQEVEAASQQRVVLEDRIAQLDGALKECMRQVRHVRDEQEVKIQEVITCKTREWTELKADMDAKQAELQRRLMESDAQNSAMVKSLQERARKILAANETKAKLDAELKVMQVKMGSAEKDISSLQYELHLLSKELEIRNEEVVYCKKSADAAHKQHLDNVQKVAKLEADCQRLRILVKKKLPGPAAIAQMRKAVEGLPTKESGTVSATAEFKRRPSRTSYASSTISFANSHQRVTTSNRNRDAEIVQDRLVSMEEENKLLKEALSKRIGELQTSWLLCAKTANRLSIAEDHLESLQGTPRDHAKTDRFDLAFTTTTYTPSIASVTDVETGFGGQDDAEEASCAESWASALIGELAHFKREKIIIKEAIKEVTEPYKASDLSSNAHVVDVNHEVVHKGKFPVVNELHYQHNQAKVLSLQCKELDHKLGAIEEALRAGEGFENKELLGLVDAAQKAFSKLEKEIEEMKSTPMQLSIPGLVVSNADTNNMTSSERDDESGPDRHMGMRVPTTVAAAMPMPEVDIEVLKLDVPAPKHMATLKCQSKTDAYITSVGCDSAVKHSGANVEEEGHELSFSSSLGFLLSKLISLLENLPRGVEDATLDADCAEWGQEKQGLEACKHRFLQGQASVLEILARVAMLMCRACHVGSREIEHMQLASFVNADMAEQEVSVNAAGFLPRQEEKGSDADVAAGGPDNCEELDADVVANGELTADVATGGTDNNKPDELDAVPGRVDAHVAAGDEVDATPDKVDGDVASASTHAELVCPDDELDAHMAIKLAQLHTEKERLCDEKDKLCEEGAIKTAQLQEAQAQLSHYKMLHSQLQTKHEELQLKLQGLEVEDDDCNAVKVLNIGEGMKQTKKSSEQLVDAKEKLAECERTMMDLGKQLYALSTTNNAHSMPRQRYLDEPPERRVDVDQRSRHRSRPSGCHVVSGPQELQLHVAHPQHIKARRHVAHPQQIKARRPRFVEAPDWLQGQVFEEEQYSPLLSARSSPARSPGRYVQQVLMSGRGSADARTRLTQSLNVAANKHSASSYKARPLTPTSSFGRLFSRSRNYQC